MFMENQEQQLGIGVEGVANSLRISLQDLEAGVSVEEVNEGVEF